MIRARPLVIAGAVCAACAPTEPATPVATAAPATPAPATPAPATPAPAIIAPADAAPTTAEHGASSLVDVASVITDAVIDIRYATPANFVGQVLSDDPRCLLRPDVARKLARAADLLRARGYRLLLWDCYRSFEVQERLWKAVADPRYVAKPVRDEHGRPVSGSRHNRGAAVDVSLASSTGAPLPMPTAYDDFSVAAHRDQLSGAGPERARARELEAAMHAAGFSGLATEWWHFDAIGWETAGVVEAARAPR